MTNTIIFLTSSYPQSKTMIPVIEQVTKYMPDVEVACLTLDNYYFQNSEKPFQENEIGFSKLNRRAGSKRYWDLSMAGRLILLYLAKLEIKKILKDFAPTLLIVGNDIGPLERLFITQQNRRKHGKTLLIQDGILNKEIFDPKGEKLVNRIKNRVKEITKIGGIEKYGMGECRYKALIGHETKEFLRNNGLDIDSCRVTGSPRFDTYYQATKNLRVNYSPGSRKIRVVFFSQPLVRYGYWSDGDWEKVREILCFPTRKVSDNFEFYIKLHPSDDISYYENSFSKIENCVKFNVLDAMDASEAIDFADIVIVYRSTIAIESLYYKKFILFLDPWGDNDGYGIPGNRAGFRISGGEEYLTFLLNYYENAIDLKILEARMEASLEYLVYANDGKSSNRVAKYINDILTSSV